MSGVVLIEIRETESELKAVLREEKDATRHEKLQVVYWLKTKTVETVLSVAVRLGKHRTTIQRWLSSYREGGIEKLLFQKPRSGRPRIMNPETVERLSNQLPEAEGFSSYKEVHQWLTSCCEVKMAYRTVHQWARYRRWRKIKSVAFCEWKTESRGSRRIQKKLSSLIKSSLRSEWELLLAMEKSAILEWRWKSDRVAYNEREESWWVSE